LLGQAQVYVYVTLSLGFRALAINAFILVLAGACNVFLSR